MKDLFTNVEALWGILLKILRDPRSGQVFLLIDALDECERCSRKHLLRCIAEVFEPETDRGGRFKLLLTCRPEDDIQYHLQGIGACLRIDTGKVNADLSKFITIKVDELARKKSYAIKLKDDVRELLASKAEGTFLWISLVLAVLENTPKHKVKEKLNALPAGLDAIYDRILQQFEEAEDARFILQCVVVARRPLAVHEIATAYAIKLGGWRKDAAPLQGDLEEYTNVFETCKPILYLDDTTSTVNLVHQSAKDYLLGDHIKLAEHLRQYHVIPENAHLLMLQVCWQYLSGEDFKRGEAIICRTQNGTLIRQDLSIEVWERYCFLGYASQEWWEHASSAARAFIGKFDFPIRDLEKAPTLRDAWLFFASQKGQDVVVGHLLEKGANPNSKYGHFWQTPLSLAAENGHHAIVKLLLAKDGVDPDSKDSWGRTPLLLSAGNGHESVVKLLLAKDEVDPDSEDNGGQTPLSLSAENGQEAVVKLLLAKDGVDPDSKDIWERTPLSLSAGNGHESVVKLLLAKDGVDPDSKDTGGQTPLSWSAGNGREAVVKLLLAKDGINRDPKDSCGRTPLSWVAEYGQEAVVKLLLAKDGVDLNSKDNQYGRTPLSWAVRNWREAVAKLLLAKDGVDPDPKDVSGQTPLLWSAENGQEALVKLLLAKDGVDLNSKDNGGRTPLSWSAENGQEAVVKLLLAKDGVDLNSKDNEGRTPLSLTMQNGHEAVAKLLLAKGGVDPDPKDAGGNTPLSWALKHGNKAVVELLLAKDEVDADSKNLDGRTPL